MKFSASFYNLIITSTQVNIDNATDWWLGDIEDSWFKALESAIKDEWGVDPIRIREGGVSLCELSTDVHAGA